MHSIAALVHKLRAAPAQYGLVYANGGLMAEHLPHMAAASS